MIINAILIIIGFVLLVKGADFLVDGASNIAKKFHIPELIIGLTVVSIGTSLPELFVSITSALNGYEDMAIGNVIGSNLCNILLILGLAAVIKPIYLNKETRKIEIPLCIFFTIIFMLLCNAGQGISVMDAGILLILFIIFIQDTIYIAKKNQDEEAEKEAVDKKTQKNTILNIILIIIGSIGLKFGGDFVVNNAKIIAEYFSISEKIISLTIVAIGTSLPELVTSVTAAIKNDGDIAVGNILGSNIFNILLIIGTSAIIHPIAYNSSYNLQMYILIFATLILLVFPYSKPKNKISRVNGIILLILYAIYMGLLFVI